MRETSEKRQNDALKDKIRLLVKKFLVKKFLYTAFGKIYQIRKTMLSEFGAPWLKS